VKLFRAEQLYTASNYQAFLSTFRTGFPQYVFLDPLRGKEVISALKEYVREVYVPKECLLSLIGLGKKDGLQKTTFDFVNLLSAESGVPFADFGVHGSVALNMHSPVSDIDIVVYGSRNFRAVEEVVDRLVDARKLSYRFNNRLDKARRFKGKYRDRIFMYNAIRKFEEVNTEYGMFRYSPIASVEFMCTVNEDSEAMFRPAIYRIKDYEPANSSSDVPENEVPEVVVSMIGCYRNVARKGDRMRVCGTLEMVENRKTGEVFHQVVVGTGVNEEEYICPL
jgi:predicted nucleotidyltransferase